MRSIRKRILFVGSFKKSGKDGSVGGQMFACRTLIESRLSDKIDWILIDSTADSNLPQGIWRRAFKALKRLLLFLYHLIFSKIDSTLIFTADGFSFVEKGSMVILSKLFRKRTILAPRSGIIINDIKTSRFMRIYIPYIINLSDKIICQGQSWKFFYFGLTKKNAEKFYIVQNWLETETYFSKDKHLDSEKTHILFLSWVNKNKGIFDLLEAISRLKNNYPKLYLEIAGDGDAMEECKRFVEKNGLNDFVIFHSWVRGKKKMQLLQRANIYVLPSYFEGFPNSLMEAMAMSCAVVSTKVGSVPDLINHNINGLLFDSGNVEGLMDCLNSLLIDNEKCISIGVNAKATIAENNTIDKALIQFEKILDI